jgi:hypothetical protein
MRLARVLVRLYPAAFQRQWGADIEAEIGRAGWRSWPNTVAGIADLWLHPVVWPARSPAQRQLRMTTMAITLTATFWYIAHLVTELDSALSSGVGHSPLMSAGTGLMLAGLFLIAPRPRPTAGVLAVLLRSVASRFAVPCALATVIVIAAHTHAIAHAPQLLRVIVVACWWIALALGAIQTCRTITDAGAEVMTPPRPWRLRTGTTILATGCAVETATIAGFCLTTRADLPATMAGVGLLALLPVFAVVLHDSRHTPPASSC